MVANTSNLNKTNEAVSDAGIPLKLHSCVWLGFMVGTLIHFSSLGGCYLITFPKDVFITDAQSVEWIWRSLVWSVITSSFGVILLIATQSLWGISSGEVDKMEFFFALGVFKGVFVSWLLIETLLKRDQGQFRMATGALSIIFAFVLFKVMTGQLLSGGFLEWMDDKEESPTVDDLAKPLLVSNDDDEEDAKEHHITIVTPSPFRIQSLSLLCGAIIGLFMQLGSVGAKYVVQQIFSLDDAPESSHRLLAFSLAASLVCSTMGIASLWVIQRMASASVNSHISVTIQSFCAIGAAFGLNLAWTLTAVRLGVQSHAVEHIFHLFFTVLWCKVVLNCTAKNIEDDNEDQQTPMIV